MLDLKIGIVSVNTEKIFIGSVPRSDLIQIFQSRVVTPLINVLLILCPVVDVIKLFFGGNLDFQKLRN